MDSYTIVKTLTFMVTIAFLVGGGSAAGQSAPTSGQIRIYEGLLKAAHENDLDSLLSLLSSDADTEVRDNAGRTPLIVAAFASNDRIVAALAEAGADMNAMDHQAYDIVTIAAVADDLELMDLALRHGASAQNITSPYDGTALIAAAHLGHVEIVDRLIKANAPLDHINNLHWTALMESVVLGDGGPRHTRTLELLLEAGADSTLADRQGITPLEHAKSRGYTEMVELLVEAAQNQSK